MNLYAPDYYLRFHCIAENCKHTCCAGWEIDIDETSMKRYQTLQGPLSEELRNSIVYGNSAHFRLTDGERCPMLNENGLCRIILAYGENELCQICADHPRFRNYWTGRTELGLGLVCEEAARLILTQPKPMRLIRLQGDGKFLFSTKEKSIFQIRNQMLAQVREHGPAARLKDYLIYRHIADAVYDGRLFQRIRFVNRAYRFILAQWQDGETKTLQEIARVFSDRVEYDSDVLEDWIANSTED